MNRQRYTNLRLETLEDRLLLDSAFASTLLDTGIEDTVHPSTPSVVREETGGDANLSGAIRAALTDPSLIDITEYDVTTGAERSLSSEEKVLALTQLQELNPENPEEIPNPLISAGSSDILPSGTFGNDGRVRVQNTRTYPFSAIGQVATDRGTGSSALISPYHLLTAAHVVRDPSTEGGKFVSSVRVALGQNGVHFGSGALQSTGRYYGEARGTYYRAYSWKNTESGYNFDIAIVTLDRRIGNFTGWFSYGYNGNDSAFLNSRLNSAGYPDSLNYRTHYQYHAFDRITSVTTHQLRSNRLDISDGNSGGPLWYYNGSGSRTIYGVAAYGNSSYNAWTRITSDKFNWIKNAISTDNSSRAPTDRPDLVDYDDWFNSSKSSISSSSLSAGNSVTVNASIRNNGTKTAGSFKVSFYASTNTDITTSDYLLGSTTVSSLKPFTSGNVKWSGNLPSSLPSGSYYIGWRIDSGGSQTEFDEKNNTGYLSSRVTVSSSVPGVNNTNPFDGDPNSSGDNNTPSGDDTNPTDPRAFDNPTTNSGDNSPSNNFLVEGTTLLVTGTSGDDFFQFFAGLNTHEVILNGTSYTVDVNQISQVTFLGNGGNDAAHLVGHSGDESFILAPGSSAVIGGNYTLNAWGINRVHADGGGGYNLASLWDSPGDDTFISSPNRGTLFGVGFENSVENIAVVYGNASGGYDQAALYDSAGNDVFGASANSAYMTNHGSAGSATFGFDVNYGISQSGGYDQAVFYDSAGIDSFWGSGSQASMGNAFYSNIGWSFDVVQAVGSSGTNYLNLSPVDYAFFSLGTWV